MYVFRFSRHFPFVIFSRLSRLCECECVCINASVVFVFYFVSAFIFQLRFSAHIITSVIYTCLQFILAHLFVCVCLCVARIHLYENKSKTRNLTTTTSAKIEYNRKCKASERARERKLQEKKFISLKMIWLYFPNGAKWKHLFQQILPSRSCIAVLDFEYKFSIFEVPKRKRTGQYAWHV